MPHSWGLNIIHATVEVTPGGVMHALAPLVVKIRTSTATEYGGPNPYRTPAIVIKKVKPQNL